MPAIGLAAALMMPAMARAAAPGPSEAVVHLVIESLRKLPEAKDPSQRLRMLEAVNRSLAISGLAQASLGGQWRKLGGADRARFVALLTRTLEKFVYPRAAQALSTLRVEFGGEEERGGGRLVRTEVSQPNGGRMPVDYLLARTGARLRIVDVYLDGQSLAQVVGERIQAALKEGGYEKLVADLERRAADGAAMGTAGEKR